MTMEVHLHRHFGEAQLRYGQYFQRIVTPSGLPALRKKRLVVSRITIRGIHQGESPSAKQSSRGQVSGSPTKRLSQKEITAGHPFGHDSQNGGSEEVVLIIHQRGRQIWAEKAFRKVCLLSCPQA